MHLCRGLIRPHVPDPEDPYRFRIPIPSPASPSIHVHVIIVNEDIPLLHSSSLTLTAMAFDSDTDFAVPIHAHLMPVSRDRVWSEPQHLYASPFPDTLTRPRSLCPPIYRTNEPPTRSLPPITIMSDPYLDGLLPHPRPMDQPDLCRPHRHPHESLPPPPSVRAATGGLPGHVPCRQSMN